jgi:hydroxypyruvate reductase 1
MAAYGAFLKSQGDAPVTWKRASSPDEVLREADVVCITAKYLIIVTNSDFSK